MGEQRCRKVGHARAGEWLTVSCRGLFRQVDQGESILMVGSPEKVADSKRL